MSMNLAGFDANNHEPMTSFEPLPAGWYQAVITDSEERPTKSGSGSYLMLTLEVIDGDMKGRKVFDRLNLNNPNSQAVEIAQRALSSICRSVNVMNPRDSQELHDRPLMIKVAVTPGDGQYGPGNDVKEYTAVEGGASTSSKPKTGGGATPPWKR